MPETEERQAHLAKQVKACATALGDAIEAANDASLIVDMEVWFHEGSESIKLNRLNGEFNVDVGRYEIL